MLIYQDELSLSQVISERFCYEGILCSDLHQSQIPMVGYFYLTPRRYIVESIFLCSVFSFILWKLHRSKTTLSPQLLKGTAYGARPSRFLQMTCFLIIGLNIFFKSTPNSKLWFLCMPCNVQWTLLLWYSFQPTDYLFELICSYWSFCLPALLNPDTDDVDNVGELEFFYLHHGLLLALVPLLVLSRIHATRQQSTTSVSLQHHLRWITISACWFGLFYFGPVTLISLLTGWNLNYMLVPPPNQLLAVGGQYRLTSIFVCVGMMFLSRVLLTALSVSARRALVSMPSSSSSASSQKAKET